MAIFNLQKARQIAQQNGMSDQDIQDYLARRPDLQVGGMNAPTPTSSQDSLSRLADWLPVAGAVGGSFIPGAGTIAGGALGAGAGTLLKQLVQKKPVDVGEIGKEAAFGGIGGVVGKVAEPAFQAARGLVGGLSEGVANKAAQSVLNTSPAQFRNAAEVGVNLNKTFLKHSPFLGNTFDEMLGPIGKKVAPELQGGNISKRIKMFEGQIGDVVKEAGTATKISGDDIISSLRNELKAEKSVIGNDARVGILEKLIGEAEKQYKNGITVGKALNKLRIANRQFGKSILEDQTGSMISSAQKLEANTLRDKLKTLFPTIGNALDNEQELIILREVLGGARAKTQAGSLGLAGLDLTKPGTILQFLLGNPKVGGKIGRGAAKVAGAASGAGAKAGAEGAAGAGAAEAAAGAGAQGVPGAIGSKLPMGTIAGRTAAQVGTRGILDQGQASPSPTEDFNTPSNGGTDTMMSDFGGQNQNQGKVKDAFLMAMMANPKQAATLKSIYDFGFGQPKTSAQKEKINIQLETGNEIANQVEKAYKDLGPTGRIAGLGQKATAIAGFNPKVTAYESIRTALVAPLARIISTEVGVLTDRDFARADAILPKLTDTPEEARLKLKQLRQAIKQRSEAVGRTADSNPAMQDFLQPNQ